MPGSIGETGIRHGQTRLLGFFCVFDVRRPKYAVADLGDELPRRAKVERGRIARRDFEFCGNFFGWDRKIGCHCNFGILGMDPISHRDREN